jgi:hypothetical protein
MNTTENNKLIAEFMGFVQAPCRNGYAWDNNKIVKPITLHGELVDGRTNGKFHTSWDWLMPVVEKCYEFGELGSEHRQTIEESLIGIVSINSTYAAVVEFIKWHNASTGQNK